MKQKRMSVREVVCRGAITLQESLESNPFFSITDAEVKTGRKSSLEGAAVQGSASLLPSNRLWRSGIFQDSKHGTELKRI